MNNKNLLFIVVFSISLLGYAKLVKAQGKPNVLVIVADDFGWADTGFQGSEFYETPNLDRLAAKGMMFTDGYAACGVCSPSRASLLTGRYTPRSGVTDWIRGYQAEKSPQQLSEYKLVGPQNVYNLPTEETTIAEVLKEGGYKTCFVGKWHLGEDAQHYPQNQGFDKNVAGWERGSPSGNRTNNQSYYTPYNNPYLTDGASGEFLTDRLVDESIQWMGENKSDPFFLYLSFYVVHTPIHPKPEKIPYYQEKATSMGLDNQVALTKDVEWIQNSPNPKGHWNERILQSSAEYAALIESMDENIGRVLNYLESSGLDENTIVVFTSDNGGLSTAETSPTCNAPLRGGKGWVYEGGIREPFILKIPGQTTAGEVSKEPVHGIDIYPTIIDACGLQMPNQNEIDGVSLLPLLNGGQLERDKLFWHYPHYGGKGDAPAGAIRKGDYKLIELFETGKVELYNLKEDMSELNDLAAQEPEIKEELLQDLKQWRSDIGAKMPEANPYYAYASTDGDANLSVYVNDTVAINPDLFGVNNDWKFISDELFPSFASTFSSLNLDVLRYPGGWESEWLNWGSNTTPGWSSAPATPGASITTVKNNYSNFSVVVPTQTALNQVYNSAGWNSAVANLKQVAKDAIDRAGSGNIKYVEIGNEWWLQYAGGVSRSNKLINYSKTAMRIAAYLAEQYPERTFNILVNGDFTEPQEFTTMKENFTEAYDEINGIALHTYTGYNPPNDKTGFAIQTLGAKIDACAKNFNSNKELLVYCSEWMAARDYNEGRVYMEAANIIPDIVQIYSRHGVDAGGYWPPVNSTAPGVGLVNWNASVVFPCGQILGDMATSFRGKAVRTNSDGNFGIASALTAGDTLLIYVTGKDNVATQVNISLHNFEANQIIKVEKFRPADYSQTNKAAPYVVESDEVQVVSPSKIRFGINSSGEYEIFKILLTGEAKETVEAKLIDFETPIEVVPDFGASFDVVQNPEEEGLNRTENCGRIGRTSALWYELIDIPCNFSALENEYRYVHIFVNYPAQPDVVLRLNQAGNEGNIRPLNSYENFGEWQDLVFEISGGESGIDINNLRYMGDCGFENNPRGFVLDNTANFGYIDEIIVSDDPTPRSVPTSVPLKKEETDYFIYAKNKAIHLNATEDRNVDVWVYTINGYLIDRHYKTTHRFEVPSTGLYIVRVGNSVQKVVVN